MKKRILTAAASLFLGFSWNASAGFLATGDATDQANADVILDIVFAIDTSGSMSDEIAGITTAMPNIISDLSCPCNDIFVRASFMGITETAGGLFNETVRNYVLGLGETPVSNQSEDNGPAVTDLANWYNWTDDSTVDQDYFKAIVTIGDEGTEDGHPIDQADWDAAFVANQAAASNDILLFSLVGTPWPSYIGSKAERDAVFLAMAEGGSGGLTTTYSFDDTGGKFIETTANTLENDLKNILCTAAGCATNIPEPATLILMGIGLLGIAHRRGKSA